MKKIGYILWYSFLYEFIQFHRLCDDIDPNISKDVENLFSTLAGNFAGVVQYNKDNKAFEVVISILIKHEYCVSVCGFVHFFLSHQKSQHHEILAPGGIRR